MPYSLFISDIHLRASQRRVTSAFIDFLQQQAARAEALYILGDLFEYWAGDDDLDTVFHKKICAALLQLSEGGTALFIMRGNRDFLMDKELAKACGATLLPDPTLLDLYDQPTLLCHGDTLCSDDVDYQTFREKVRSAAWKKQFLALPLKERKKQITALRKQSTLEKACKDSRIMDVNLDAVCALLREHGYPVIIHGHTHHPAHHLIHLDDYSCHRWVLSDWEHTIRFARADTQGISLETFIPSAPAG